MSRVRYDDTTTRDGAKLKIHLEKIWNLFECEVEVPLEKRVDLFHALLAQETRSISPEPKRMEKDKSLTSKKSHQLETMSFATLKLSSGCVSDLYLRFVFSHYQCIVLDFSSALLAIKAERRSHIQHGGNWLLLTEWEYPFHMDCVSRRLYGKREAPPYSSFLFISLQEIKLNLFGCLEFSQCRRTEDLAGRGSSSLLPLLISSSRLFSVVLSLDKTRKFIFFTLDHLTLDVDDDTYTVVHFVNIRNSLTEKKCRLRRARTRKGARRGKRQKSQTAAAAVDGTGALSTSLNVVEHKKRCNIFRMLREDNLCVRERVKRAIKNSHLAFLRLYACRRHEGWKSRPSRNQSTTAEAMNYHTLWAFVGRERESSLCYRQSSIDCRTQNVKSH